VFTPIGVRRFAIGSLGIVDLDWAEIVTVAICLMDFLNDGPNMNMCSNAANKSTAVDHICRQKRNIQ
jgi:hypothetical protein